MTTSEMFTEFIDNIKVDNAEQISLRYGEITSSLNKKFRDTESKTANSLQVGSYGRWTAIKHISDLDMLYIMPQNKWSKYKDRGQSQLLRDCRDAILARYPSSKVSVDRLVVVVKYTNFHIEVQPVFENLDGNGESYFNYPDTYDGGSWKVTKPRQEIAAMKEFVEQKNKNLRRLCKMARAWKNKHGVAMGGLLIDTLAYNFLKSRSEYDDKGAKYYGCMNRDFFKYLMDQPNQDHYKALGSFQNVRVKKKFQRKAKKAYGLCIKAIEVGESDRAHDKWKKVYGRPFPGRPNLISEAIRKTASLWNNTEEFIEDKYPIDIKNNVGIECQVSQSGFRTMSLRKMLGTRIPLLASKKLTFQLSDIDVHPPFSIEWKVLNRGGTAQKKDKIRGQIVPGGSEKVERTQFRGNHIVECYIIKDDIVVAKNRINVPISIEGERDE